MSWALTENIHPALRQAVHAGFDGRVVTHVHLFDEQGAPQGPVRGLRRSLPLLSFVTVAYTTQDTHTHTHTHTHTRKHTHTHTHTHETDTIATAKTQPKVIVKMYCYYCIALCVL